MSRYFAVLSALALLASFSGCGSRDSKLEEMRRYAIRRPPENEEEQTPAPKKPSPNPKPKQEAKPVPKAKPRPGAVAQAQAPRTAPAPAKLPPAPGTAKLRNVQEQIGRVVDDGGPLGNIDLPIERVALAKAKLVVKEEPKPQFDSIFAPIFGDPSAEENEVVSLPPDMDAAIRHMVSKREGEKAVQLFYVQALTSGPGESWVEQMKWVPALRKPVPAVRWAMAVEYSGPDKFRNHPEAIPLRPELNSKLALTQRSPLVKTAGEPGALVASGLLNRFEEGFWGPLLQAETSGRGGRINERQEKAENGVLYQVLASGVAFFGIEDRNPMIVAGKSDGFDVLIVFDVQTRTTRGSLYNSTSLRVINLDSENVLYASEPMVNIRVETFRKNPVGKDPVDEEIDKFFALVDKQFRPEPLPSAIKPEHAAGRVLTLLEQQYENPLPVLTEIRFYHEMKLLTDEQLLYAYQKLLGEQAGAKLIEGTSLEKAQAIGQWIPEVPTKLQTGAR